MRVESLKVYSILILFKTSDLDLLPSSLLVFSSQLSAFRKICLSFWQYLTKPDAAVFIYDAVVVSADCVADLLTNNFGSNKPDRSL